MLARRSRTQPPKARRARKDARSGSYLRSLRYGPEAVALEPARATTKAAVSYALSAPTVFGWRPLARCRRAAPSGWLVGVRPGGGCGDRCGGTCAANARVDPVAGSCPSRVPGSNRLLVRMIGREPRYPWTPTCHPVEADVAQQPLQVRLGPARVVHHTPLHPVPSVDQADERREVSVHPHAADGGRRRQVDQQPPRRRAFLQALGYGIKGMN